MHDDGWEHLERGHYLEYVLSSAVRQSLVSGLLTDARSTAELVQETTYSDSAVYNALGNLHEKGLIERRSDDRWELTGLGQILADWIAIADRTEALVQLDEEYWQQHDVSVIPGEFRREISVLADSEIVRASETNPQTVQARVVELLSDAESIDVMSEVQHPQYATAVEERAEIASPRLIFDAGVVESPDAGRYRQPEEWADGVTLHVHEDIRFTLGIIDDTIVLSLPTLAGSYDTYTEIVATGDALEWGRALFDHYLGEATPVREYLESSPSGS